jgi:hypothetical protein
MKYESSLIPVLHKPCAALPFVQCPSPATGADAKKAAQTAPPDFNTNSFVWPLCYFFSLYYVLVTRWFSIHSGAQRLHLVHCCYQASQTVKNATKY